MSTKNKIPNLPHATQNAYIKTVLGQHPNKIPNDFVEVLIDQKRKQLIKKKNVIQKK